MFRSILRRSLSALLCMAFLLTTLSAAFSMTASAKVEVGSTADPPDVKFIVPEAIYLKPTWNAFYQSQQMPFQIYVNNTLSGGNVTCDTEEATQGKIYFYFANTDTAQISFAWLNEAGATLYDGNITYGNGITRNAGVAYTASSSTSVIPITAGTSPTLATSQNGAYIRWKAVFTDSTDGREKIAYAYTYVYKPYISPVGVATHTCNDRGTDSFGSDIAWIAGVHGIVSGTAGTRYPNTTLSSDGRGLMTISSSVNNGVKIKDLYAQLASDTANLSRFSYSDITNEEPGNWLNTTSSPLMVPDATFNYMENTISGPGSGDVAFYSLQWSPTAALTVDSSRYSNLNQIPNLSIGMLVTNDKKSESSGAWFMGNYSGTLASTVVKEAKKNDTSGAEAIWNQYATDLIASAGTYASPVGGEEAEGVKVNKKWPKAFNSGTASTTFCVGAGYFNHDGTGSHYGGDTIWNVMELRAAVNFYNKGTLRTAVLNAIGKSAILNNAFYDVSSDVWANYENLFRASSMALTKLNGTFYASASVNNSVETYSSPAALATALNNAVNTLLSGSGRLDRTVTQANVGLSLQPNGTYKCVAIEGGTAKQSTTFTSYDKVKISADNYSGYTFLGLVQTTYSQSVQVGSVVQLPTNFTASVPGATIADGTVTYAHTDVSGTDGRGNIYYTYYYLVNSYSVRFHANGGNGTMADQAFNYGEEQNLSINTFARRAYSFAGWATSSTGSAIYADEQRVKNLTADNDGLVDLYAIWTPETYTIMYNTQGGSVIGEHTTTYTVETPVGLPTAIKPGYSLSGWRANGAGNWGEMTYGVSASVPAGKYGNVMLSAQWSPITYYVSFNGNGATSGGMSDETFTYEETRALTANAYQRVGYSFAGWALTEDATAAMFKDKASVSNLTTTADETVTLYAVWTPSMYTIIYNTDGGTIRDDTYASQYTIADAVQLPVQVEKTGYAFGGWKPSASVGNWDAQTAYNGMQTAGMYGSITLNAQWTTQAYTIQYLADGGTITSGTYTTEYSITSSITLPTAQKTGCTLTGWVADGTGNWGATLYTAGNVGAGKYGNVKMTAQWKGVTYLIAFDGNKSTDGVMYNLNAEYGKDVVLTANAYVRNGYSFLGWSTSNAAATPTYTDGATVRNLSSTQGDTVTLYAVWRKLSYTVTYDPLGGTITAAGTAGYTVTDLLQLAEVARAGYTFKGWTPASTTGAWQALVLYSGTLNAGFYGDVTLVAQWEKNVYAIRYDAAGGTMSGNYTTEYSVDTVITLPSVVRAGYAFDGWQADAAWNEALVTGTTVPAGHTGDVVLRAVWVQRVYSIRFNACGGSGTMENQTVQFDIEQPLTLNAFTRPGYNFDGWAAEAGGTVVYTNGASVYNLCLVDNGVVDLYAAWSARSFTIRYDMNGAGGSMLTSTAVMDGAAITLRNCTQTEVTMNDIPFQFSGWAFTKAEADAGTAVYANKDTFELTEEVLSRATVDWSGSKPILTLYAVWVNIKVTLNGKSGAIVDDEHHLIYGVETQLNERILREKYLSLTGYGSVEIEYGTYIGTGTTILLKNAAGDTVETYQLVIYGDLDGDGILTQQDINTIKSIMNGAQTEPEDSLVLKAGDMDGDGFLSLMDIMTIKGIMNGSIEYNQATQTF